MPKKHSRRAFSLVEVSISIVLLGLIIAGLTQSSRLISAYRLYIARGLTQSGPVTTIPNLVFWIDASAEGVFLNQNSRAEISNNDTISSWSEPKYLSRERKACTESTAANQPTFILNGINGLPIARFSSTAAQMRLSCLIEGGMSSENTIFMIYKWNSTYTPANTNFLVIGSAIQTLTAVSTTGQLNFYSWNGAAIDSITYMLTAGANMLLSRVSNPSTNVTTVYVNGASIGSTTALWSGTYTSLDTSTSVTIGNYPGQPRPLGGDIAEVIIYDRALNNEERQAVEKYLGKKWGIKVN